MTPASAAEVRRWRSNKDVSFARQGIVKRPLNYFPYDPKYRVVGTFIPTKEVVTLDTSKGTRKMVKTAIFKFTLDGEEHTLSVYDDFFMPFRDQSEETYKGGRYLDIDKSGVVDFNMAYNPLCLFKDRYDCPIVPAENTLPIKIEAGEKMYHG